jgi:hypothetical protein
MVGLIIKCVPTLERDIVFQQGLGLGLGLSLKLRSSVSVRAKLGLGLPPAPAPDPDSWLRSTHSMILIFII